MAGLGVGGKCAYLFAGEGILGAYGDGALGVYGEGRPALGAYGEPAVAAVAMAGDAGPKPGELSPRPKPAGVPGVGPRYGEGKLLPGAGEPA